MMDFTTLQQLPILVLSNLILLLMIYNIMKRSLIPPYCVSIKKRRYALLLILFFCLFSFWGADWFHYIAEYLVLHNEEKYLSNLEEVYVFISLASPNYIIFRLIIWGGACLFLFRTFYLIPVKTDLLITTFVIIGLIWFGYARVSLAMAIMFYGAVYLVEKGYKRYIGFLFVLSSF